MPNIHAQANWYLTPPIKAFWNWSEDGEAVVWTENNQTIAFRPELATILRRHISKGLPPFGSLLLLVAACRDSWGTAARRSDKSALQELMGEKFHQLNNIRGIPSELRTGAAAKAELSAMIFETVGGRTSPAVAEAVVDALDHGLALEQVRQDDPFLPTSSQLQLSEYMLLWEGLQRFDVEAFKLRLETGLEELTAPAEVEEPLATRIRKLFDQLQNDEEFTGLVRMARNLLAMVSLPRPLVQPDEIPVGGVSDIANRGTLDRLLLSELAQDDEMLMMRVAMNEAMYLRRETPPRNPPRTRLLLLDTGLRMWGIPRVMATSVAMSFAAMNDGPTDLRVLRGERSQLHPADLSTREGLIDHLKVLDPHSHPGEALGDLARWMTAEEHETDVILVTCDDVLADREFQEWLGEFGEPIEFLATVSRTGEFQLLQRTMHGTRLLRKAHLNLEQLLAPAKERKPALPLVDPNVSTDLPAILRLDSFPLRLSHHITPQQSWQVRHRGKRQVLAITNDRRLMHWDVSEWGAKQLTDRLVSRRLLWCQTRSEKGRTHFVVGNASKPNLQLGIVDLEHGACELHSLDISASHVQGVCSHAGVLFVVHHHDIDVCDMASGERITSMKIPQGFRWTSGRYFREEHQWKALSFDGVVPRFEDVTTSTQYQLIVFDVDGVQGPVEISFEGSRLGLVIDDEAHSLVEYDPPIHVVGISPGGTTVVVEHKWDAKSSRFMETLAIDVLNRRVTPVYGDRHHALGAQCWPLVCPRHYRNRIRAIGGQAGGLLIHTPSHFLSLSFDEGRNRFRIQSATLGQGRVMPMQRFKPIPPPPGVGYKLQRAEWSDGSRAFLDSRGLLHLKSSDPQIPEITFVLYDEHIAGWCANGAMWGEEYFTGIKPALNAKVAEGLFGKESQRGSYRTPIKILSEFVSRLR